MAPAIAATCAALACGVITLQPDPTAPMNQCTDDPSCSTIFPEAGAGTCTSGVCSTTTFPGGGPFLVVAVPRDIAGLGGVTMPLPTSYQVVRGQFAQKGALPLTSPACLNAQQNAPATECDPIPPLSRFFAGVLEIATGFDSTLVPPNGLRPNNKPSQAPTAMPVNVTVEMLWKDPATGTYVPARKLGIALDDVTGVIDSNQQLVGPTLSASQVPGYEFAALVPQPLTPGDPMNAYRLYLEPPNPYGAIPPLLIKQQGSPLLQPSLGAVSQAVGHLTYDTPSADGGGLMEAHTYSVVEAPGAPSLEGWTLHIDDQNGHRVSGNVSLLAGATKSVAVYEATSSASQGDTTPTPNPDRYIETLFIDPPNGMDVPRYFSQAVGGQIVGPFTYAALPSKVDLSGRVLTSDGQPHSAGVIFVADGENDAIVEADLSTPATSLFYEKRTAATADGQYAISFYPGMSRVYVVPDDPLLALTVFDKQIGSASPQKGVTLQVNRRSHVRGRVVLANGKPVYAADVVIGASADAPFLAKDDPLARPRESRGTTDVNGMFDVPSDPGFVDVSVRPHDGTSFPWVVLTNRVVAPSDGADGGGPLTLNLGDIVIPEPARYTQAAMGVLTDSVGNPITHAVVRAYAFPPLATGVDGGAPATRGARLVGLTVTDDSAAFQLFVVPPE